MKTRSQESSTEQLPPDDAGMLADAERAELQRQGAKAAARGDKSSANPMHQPPNMPTATGESTDIWQQRQEAWQRGHDVESRTQDATTPHPELQEKDDGRE
jgi:hypothetical protein